MHAFRATLYKNGTSYCVDIPASVTSTWTDRHVPVKLVVEGLVDRTTAVRRKDDGYRVFVRISIRELAGLTAGSEAAVELEPAPERTPRARSREHPTQEPLKPGDQLEDEIVRTVRVLDTEDGCDVGVVQRREHSRLACFAR